MGGGGQSTSSQTTAPTTTTNTTTTTQVGSIDSGLTGQDAVNLAATLGNQANNMGALVYGIEQNNGNNADVQQQQLLTAEGTGFSQLLGGANNLISATNAEGALQATNNANTLAAAAAVVGAQQPNFESTPATVGTVTSTPMVAGLSPTMLLLIAGVALYFMMEK